MKGTTIRIGVSKNTATFFKRNAVLLLFVAVLLSGYVCGIFTSFCEVQLFKRVFSALADSAVKSRVGNNVFDLFISSFTTTLLFVLPAFLSGVSLAGIPLLAVIAFLNGALPGVVAGVVVAEYSFIGFAFYLSVIIIPVFISAIAVLLACKEACGYSAFLVKIMAVGSGGSLLNDFRVYCIRYLIVIGVALVAAFTDMLLASLFGGMFHII